MKLTIFLLALLAHAWLLENGYPWFGWAIAITAAIELWSGSSAVSRYQQRIKHRAAVRAHLDKLRRRAEWRAAMKHRLRLDDPKVLRRIDLYTLPALVLVAVIVLAVL